MLGGGGVKRAPPGSLAAKTAGNRTFSAEAQAADSLAVKREPSKMNPASLNLSNVMGRSMSVQNNNQNNNNNNNKSMDLSTIMAQINQSPAPQPMRRRPGGAAAYLSKKNAQTDNCAIF
mmetsp:Transcript_46970/g.62170  ORF Transcript_46970/g.62170 Transcript_46970/m.62170 type:complete len:119 (-) Transcript_46970:37-393(-)